MYLHLFWYIQSYTYIFLFKVTLFKKTHPVTSTSLRVFILHRLKTLTAFGLGPLPGLGSIKSRLALGRTRRWWIRRTFATQLSGIGGFHLWSYQHFTGGSLGKEGFFFFWGGGDMVVVFGGIGEDFWGDFDQNGIETHMIFDVVFEMDSIIEWFADIEWLMLTCQTYIDIY